MENVGNAPFLNQYSQVVQRLQIPELLSAEAGKLRLKGLVGSAHALLAAATSLSLKSTHVFVLEDKEKAAYFLNDLENILHYQKEQHEQANILFFPRSARVPYQNETVDNANVAMRAEVLNLLRKKPLGQWLVTYPEALAEKVIGIQKLEQKTFEMEVGTRLNPEIVDEVLQEYGFYKVDFVYEPGQYAVRGGIIDIFSFSFDHPYRIELFGDEIDSIRKFNPVDQLSLTPMKKATIVPNIQDETQMEGTINFLEFIHPDAVIWMVESGNATQIWEKELEKAHAQFSKLSGVIQHKSPEELYAHPKDWFHLLKDKRVMELGSTYLFHEGPLLTFSMTPQPAFNKKFDMLSQHLIEQQKKGFEQVVTAGQAKQLERLHQIFEDQKWVVEFTPHLIELSEGFVDLENNLALYTDHQIFERYHRFRLKEGFQRNKEAITLKEILSLQPGDYVVHIDHGLGQFAGLQKIDVNGKEQEAIRLVYKGGDMLYVSIHSLHRISKYSGKEGSQPTMDRLGSQVWQNLKQKTKAKVKTIAFDLIKLYAKRKNTQGYPFLPDGYLQMELEASFMYEDTPDQMKAIQAVKKDMESNYPMDRLVCGDVGFGKTEVAMRAAFKAATDGKQVAVLVPTTILALQHFKSFSSRFRDFPVTVDHISRFKSAKEKKITLEKVAKGQVDILIGTHAIIGKDVKFKDLGLLVIDEEQKFGVAAKDKLKTFKANVDTLTLTATPIPRTLQFSLMGARDMSIIQTPPPNRHPIHTQIITLDEELIRDAISYEIQRGGQIFFVNNRIQNLPEIAGMIQRLCPDARVGVGHGQMKGDQLENVMTTFIEGGYDVLVSTSIVESGIDIANANTMIINNAHQFGMSDLHQLRGRVGRNNKRAFCYLISPPLHLMPDDTRKRLTAIEQFSDLGSGLHIAMRDLDIRGAGDLLGGDQSGFINEMGLETYQKILAEALEELKQEHFQDLYQEELERESKFVKETNLETDMELLIPDDYISDITERIAIYKALDDIETEDSMQQYMSQLVDRFGPIPAATLSLIDTMRIRWIANQLGAEKLVLKSGKMILYFISKQDSPFYQSEVFTKILEFLKHHSHEAKMYEKDQTLRMSFNSVTSVQQALNYLRKMTDYPIL
jgi:transcription-repair coupling factor (superfamily II helicase)